MTPHDSHEKLGKPSPPLLLQAPRRPFWKRGGVWLIALVLLAVAATVAWRSRSDARSGGEASSNAAARSGRPGSAGAPGSGKGMGGRSQAPVVVATAKRGDLDVYLNGLGTVVPLNTVAVKSRVDGQLLRVLFREGQMVKKGEMLAEIDPRPFDVQLTQAEGQMARDQALLANAKVDLERYKTLFAQDSIARQQVDTQASLVRQYEGNVKVDQGLIDNAKLQLSYTKITAPIAGRAGLRQVDPGNMVHASDTNGIVVLTQLQPISVLFTVPEDNLPAVMARVRSGDKVPVDGWDRAQKTRLASGVLHSVDNQIDPTTGTIKMKAQFSNTDGMLFPNQFVNTRMLVDVLRNVTLIPSAGVQRGAQGTFVYLLQPDSTVALRAVKVGPSQGEMSAITSGIKPGDQVVVEGVDRLRDGAKVEVANAPAGARGGKRNSGDGARGTPPEATGAKDSTGVAQAATLPRPHGRRHDAAGAQKETQTETPADAQAAGPGASTASENRSRTAAGG